MTPNLKIFLKKIKLTILQTQFLKQPQNLTAVVVIQGCTTYNQAQEVIIFLIGLENCSDLN